MRNHRIVFAVAGEASNAAGSAKPVAKPVVAKAEVKILAISTAVPMPENVSRRGSKTKYAYADLQIGQSIPVIGRSAKSLNSTVSGWNREFLVPVKDAEGKPVFKLNAKNENEAVTEQTRHFFAHDCDPKKDPEGATCRIWRDK